MIDPLSEIVSLLTPKAVGAKLISGAGKWVVQYSEFGHPSFCTVLDGSCLLQIAGNPVVTLRSGDFLLLPTTPRFVLSGFEPTEPKHVEPTSDSDSVAEIRHGEQSGEPDVVLLGGYFHLDSLDASLLSTLIPSPIHIKEKASLAHIVHLVSQEAKRQEPGRALVLQRLVEILLIEALRLGQTKESPASLLKGLADVRLAEVVRRIHQDPARDWSVKQFAETAMLSRSAFYDRFTKAVGIPPMEYVFIWRMALAKKLLKEPESSIEAVAHKVGYISATTFSMAFSRHVGEPPGRFARHAANL